MWFSPAITVPPGSPNSYLPRIKDHFGLTDVMRCGLQKINTAKEGMKTKTRWITIREF